MQLSPIPPQRQAILNIPQDAPAYRIKSGGFFAPNDHLYLEGAVLLYDDEPNLEMEPLNELAVEKMKAFLTKLDIQGRAAAKKAGKSYTSYLDAFENARSLGRSRGGVRELTSSTDVPLMGAKKQSSIRQVTLDEINPINQIKDLTNSIKQIGEEDGE